MPRSVVLLVVAAAVLVAGCSSDDSSGDTGPMAAREIHRQIEVICADELDTRLDGGAAADPGAFLEAGARADDESAIDAAAYNIEALDRLAGEVAELDAAGGADSRALADAVAALEERQGTWQDRYDQLSSGSVVLDGDEALLDMVRDGADSTEGWAESLEHFGVDEPDCATVVP